VVVTAVFHPLPGNHEKARTAILDALPDVHAEPGCLLYALHDAADGTLVLIEKWESPELLDAHAAGAPVARLNRAIEGLLEKPPTVVTMTPVPGGDACKGRI
jgi:quinol monooxygenase YgiN